jgi:hypothetical protein
MTLQAIGPMLITMKGSLPTVVTLIECLAGISDPDTIHLHARLTLQRASYTSFAF